MHIRRSRYAGSFFAGSREALRQQIEDCFNHTLGPGQPVVNEQGARSIIGLVSPHAGYMYSGPVAAHSYHGLAADGKPDTVVILGPNHTGRGSGLALMKEGVWRTPLGDTQIDSETARRIIDNSSIVDVDETAHYYEHSIEVQLPFLQYLYGSKLQFVPICFLIQDLESSVEVGKAIAESSNGKDLLIVASTDMTHYEPQQTAQEKDRKALKALEELDERQFYHVIGSFHITACGYGPVTALITAAKILGAKKGRILSYQTSGDITGDHSAVVGYASAALVR